jgi:hypothetical protein
MIDGNLHRGWKILSAAYDNGNYQAVLWNNGGTTCHDDSGGPDFWWNGMNMELAGIHSGALEGCGGGWDLNIGASAFKTWVQQTAVMPMVYPGSNETPLWAAANAADYDPTTSYSSQYFASAANDRNVFYCAYSKDAVDANAPVLVNQVTLRARKYNGQVQAFPQHYYIFVTNESNTEWQAIVSTGAQPDATGMVTVNFPDRYNWGMCRPASGSGSTCS